MQERVRERWAVHVYAVYVMLTVCWALEDPYRFNFRLEQHLNFTPLLLQRCAHNRACPFCLPVIPRITRAQIESSTQLMNL